MGQLAQGSQQDASLQQAKQQNDRYSLAAGMSSGTGLRFGSADAEALYPTPRFDDPYALPKTDYSLLGDQFRTMEFRFGRDEASIEPIGTAIPGDDNQLVPIANRPGAAPISDSIYNQLVSAFDNASSARYSGSGSLDGIQLAANDVMDQSQPVVMSDAGSGGSGLQEQVPYTAEEQAQDFARENNRFASAAAANADNGTPLTPAQQQAMAMGYGPLTPEAAEQRANMIGGLSPEISQSPATILNSNEGKIQPKGNNLGLSDDQILAGKNDPWSRSQVSIDHENRMITVEVEINYRTGSLSDQDAQRLKALSSSAISKFWGGSVDLNGEQYGVTTLATESKDGIPIALKIENGREYQRSVNTGMDLFGGKIYYNAGFFKDYPGYADMNFQLTAAHEIGHSILKEAGGTGFSWGHEGTSTAWGSVFSTTPTYPASGPIDLMRYYNGNMSTPSQFQRTSASESDVKNLIYISKRK